MFRFRPDPIISTVFCFWSNQWLQRQITIHQLQSIQRMDQRPESNVIFITTRIRVRPAGGLSNERLKAQNPPAKTFLRLHLIGSTWQKHWRDVTSCNLSTRSFAYSKKSHQRGLDGSKSPENRTRSTTNRAKSIVIIRFIRIREMNGPAAKKFTFDKKKSNQTGPPPPLSFLFAWWIIIATISDKILSSVGLHRFVLNFRLTLRARQFLFQKFNSALANSAKSHRGDFNTHRHGRVL